MAENNGIPDTLLHGFKRFGRNNYVLTPMVKKNIDFYYVSCKSYSRRQITEMLNEKLRLRGLKPVSYSAVTLYLRSEEVKNRLDALRKGKEYARNHLLPHLTRKEPEGIADPAVAGLRARVRGQQTLHAFTKVVAEQKQRMFTALNLSLHAFTKAVAAKSTNAYCSESLPSRLH